MISRTELEKMLALAHDDNRAINITIALLLYELRDRLPEQVKTVPAKKKAPVKEEEIKDDKRRTTSNNRKKT